jgi:hypothetical protein
MLYRNKTTGAVKTQGEIRRDNANTSFPAVWDATVCELLNIDPVLEGAQPSHTEYQGVRQDGVEQDSLGNWVTKYVVYDFDQEAIDAIDAAKVQANKDKATQLLVASDFYDLPNTANKITNIADIVTYRDALRAIALNPTKDAEFPVKPETVWA